MRLLCDANIIIEAYSKRKWSQLANTYHIFTGSVIANEECVYYNEKYQKRYIDLKNEAKKGKLRILASTTEEITAVLKKVTRYKIIIHPGETELIALMLRPQYSDSVFCTADKAAVHAAHIFDLLPRVVSLEHCLRRSSKLKLAYKCSEKRMENIKAEAIQNF